MEFELKLSTGKCVVWEGSDAIAASQRYADAHHGSTVVAWRHYPRHGVFQAPERNLASHIIEPGHPLWGKRGV